MNFRRGEGVREGGKYVTVIFPPKIVCFFVQKYGNLLAFCKPVAKSGRGVCVTWTAFPIKSTTVMDIYKACTNL
jgi:hypothetical protein